MKTKIYTYFTDDAGNEYSFESYDEFASWWFEMPWIIAKRAFSPETFKKLDRAATQSKEARAAV
jgi:hypothetical protein